MWTTSIHIRRCRLQGTSNKVLFVASNSNDLFIRRVILRRKPVSCGMSQKRIHRGPNVAVSLCSSALVLSGLDMLRKAVVCAS